MREKITIAFYLCTFVASNALAASNEFRPSFSPDGKYLAFYSDRDGDNEIYRLHLLSGTIEQLTQNDVEDEDPNYSPDGQQVTYHSGVGKTSSIVVKKFHGGDPIVLTDPADRAIVPVWAPSGETIFYRKLVAGSWEIHSVDLASGDIRKVSSMPGDHLSIGFYQNGDRMLFSYVQAGESHDTPLQLYSMQANGTEIRPFMPHQGGDSNATFSPDGTQIVFNSIRDLNWEVYLMDVNGKNQRRLTQNQTTELTFDVETIDGQPTWSPDGSSIAFASGRGGDFDIYLINPDTGWLINLTGLWN